MSLKLLKKWRFGIPRRWTIILREFLGKTDFENGKSMKPKKARHVISNGGLRYYEYWAYTTVSLKLAGETH
jgi:hypothetical protein